MSGKKKDNNLLGKKNLLTTTMQPHPGFFSQVALCFTLWYYKSVFQTLNSDDARAKPWDCSRVG
ncbi:MAG TPA: hypothetical protein DEA97_11475 [Bacteroidales bacterium]|nr:hypothetical protein [Bacteroidales bacterium]